jgi:hypothetical protein
VHLVTLVRTCDVFLTGWSGAALVSAGWWTRAAVSAEINYRGIRGAEEVLDLDENWRLLGTDDDPALRAARLTREESRPVS